MGVDAYIKIARIGDGLHLLPEKAPVFKVVEPTAVIPLHFEIIHGLNGDFPMMTTRSDRIDNLLYLHFQFNHSAVFLWDEMRIGSKFGEPDPLFGIIPISLSEYERLITQEERTGTDYHDIGGIEYQRLKKEWENIIPGYWCVVDYHTSGLHDDVCWDYHLPKDCQVTHTVEWAIWT